MLLSSLNKVTIHFKLLVFSLKYFLVPSWKIYLFSLSLAVLIQVWKVVFSFKDFIIWIKSVKNSKTWSDKGKTWAFPAFWNPVTKSTIHFMFLNSAFVNITKQYLSLPITIENVFKMFVINCLIYLEIYSFSLAVIKIASSNFLKLQNQCLCSTGNWNIPLQAKWVGR